MAAPVMQHSEYRDKTSKSRTNKKISRFNKENIVQ